MSNIKITETFFSFQGEGIHCGTPSVFLRTFGCNFRCKNFSRSPSEVIKGPNPEVARVIQDIDQYQTYEDLPLVSTGCDSYSSTYAEFKRFAKTYNSSDLAVKLLNLTPNVTWNRDCHLVITGGEPLLGWQGFYPSLLNEPEMEYLTDLTFETNGTQNLSDDFYDYLSDWGQGDVPRNITFSVSPKLSCSGEPFKKAIKPHVIEQYCGLEPTIYLKFVVGTDQDVEEALEYTDLYRNAGFAGSVYLMPVGGTAEQFKKSNKQVAELAMKHGLRYSDRMHIEIFGNQWGT